MKNVTTLVNDLSEITSINRLKGLLTKCLRRVTKNKDPVAAHVIADVLDQFKDSVSSGVFEAAGVIPDADFYRSFAFHRFMKLAKERRGDAARWISQYYLVGYCPVEKDHDSYLKWLKLAADYGDKISLAELKEGKASD